MSGYEKRLVNAKCKRSIRILEILPSGLALCRRTDVKRNTAVSTALISVLFDEELQNNVFFLLLLISHTNTN